MEQFYEQSVTKVPLYHSTVEWSIAIDQKVLMFNDGKSVTAAYAANYAFILMLVV